MSEQEPKLCKNSVGPLGPPCNIPATVKIKRKRHHPKTAWRYLCDGCADRVLSRVSEPLLVVKVNAP